MSRRPWVMIAALLAGVSLLAADAADPYAAQPMTAVPRERCALAGQEEGMPLFPSLPVAGHPGADPGVEDRRPWAQPELVNYPGSVEHFRCDDQKYIHPVNPYNHRTLLKAFPAQSMPGVTAAMKELWAEPVQFVYKQNKPPLAYPGDKRPPVEVVRLTPGGERLSFKLPPLPTSLYCVRLIAALESKDVMDNVEGALPKDLIIDLKINDGPNGETSHYVLRQRGTDNFYSLGEFFFRAEDARSWEASVGLHGDSKVDLMVHTVDVHDVLAECARRAGKKASILSDRDILAANWATPEAAAHTASMAKEIWPRRLAPLREEFPDKSEEELRTLWRQRRDDVYWHVLPGINMNFEWGASALAPAVKAELDAKNLTYDFGDAGDGTSGRGQGPWKYDTRDRNFWREYSAPFRLVRTDADGTKRYFSIQDFAANKPFPDLPLTIPNWGLRTEDESGRSYCFTPQAQLVGGALSRLLNILQNELCLRGYQLVGDQDSAHDTALLLCRLAYDLPTYSTSHKLWNVLTPADKFFNRLPGHQHRRVHYKYIDWTLLAQTYDGLFPFIQGNQALADAVGRYVKWVKRPEDVIALLDTYLLQYGAREALYFQQYYGHEHAGILAKLAAYQTDAEIATPWVKGIFTRTWEYDFSYAGIEDYMYLSTQRDGTTTIGSFFYTQAGGIAGQVAEWLDYYIQYGGDPQYRLSDLKRYPRVGAFPYFTFEGRVAGMHPLGIGDVGGPSSEYGKWFDSVGDWALRGWRWSGDPRFAYLVVNYGDNKGATMQEWQDLQATARTVRNPFMSNKSRVLSDWAGILEGGQDSDDFRFRHAARVRVGQGEGHKHDDSLDLGLWSMGLTMAGDAGARGGYGSPTVFASEMHNVVTVDDASWMGHSWVPQLADLGVAHYLKALGQYQEHFERQIALIEVDQGRPAVNPPSDPSLKPGTTYDPDIVLPRAYVADVFRVRGGKKHAYNFHGPTEDAFEASTPRGPLTPEEAARLEADNFYVLKGEQWGADIDRNHFTATWRMAREQKTFTAPERGERKTPAAEPMILGAAYDANSPRKYLRVHLLGQQGSRATSGVWISAPNIHEGRSDGDWLRKMHVARPASPEGSLFAAIWEPFTGTPFIKTVRFAGDPADASSPAVLLVETVDGVRDLSLFAGPSLTQPQALDEGASAEAHYAFLSRDKNGIRSVAMVAGKRLQFGELTLAVERAFWESRTVSVDYLENRAVLDQALPAHLLDGAFFEVGAAAIDAHAERWTTFEATSVSGTQLHWRKGAGCFSGKIASVTATATGAEVSVEFMPNFSPGQNTQLVAANARGDKVWRCDIAWNKLVLYGAPVANDDLRSGERISLYEIGAGDLWRTPTRVSLERSPTGYRLHANVSCTLELTAKDAKRSLDGGKTWSDMPAGDKPGVKRWVLSTADVANKALMLRWTR